MGNVYPDDIAPPQHSSSMAANFRGLAINVDGIDGETLKLKAWATYDTFAEGSVNLDLLDVYVDGQSDVPGLTYDIEDVTEDDSYTFNFGGGIGDKPVIQFSIEYNGTWSDHDFQFGIFEELDTDEDGMPDNYEDEFGLAKDVNDANEDLDGDGLTNFQEFAAGTLPNDANSVFKISINELGAFTATVEWTSIPGQVYIVESSTDMTTWIQHPGTPEVTATQNTSMMTINLEANETRYFFRARKKDS